MAIIKLENVAATASITIQLIKDYSMYSSEIISSNGTIFQNTDTDTTLTFKVYKGVEDITNKITDVVWSKFYFDNDELKEDYTWGNLYNGKSKIVLHKNEIDEKSIIQASGYAIIEGIRELVTTARITIIKISDVYVSDITPNSPSDNMIWMDTNTDPPVLKIWNAGLGLWISSGTDIPIVKNTIKNSNFWTAIENYYEIENSYNIVTPSIIKYQNKNWAILQSKNRNSQSGGLAQNIDYPITKNSNYYLSFLAYRDSSLTYNGTQINIGIYSEDSKGNTDIILETTDVLTTSIGTVDVPFKTLDNTERLYIYIGTQSRANCKFYITDLSLYNSSVYYPWELCPDDVEKQMNAKLDNTRSSVFNTLMDNGSYQAFYESNNQYYVRAEYISPEITLKSDFDSLSEKLLSLENQNLLSKYNTLINNYNTLTNNYNSLINSYNSLTNKYNTLESNYNNLINTISSLESRIKDLEDSSNKE